MRCNYVGHYPLHISDCLSGLATPAPSATDHNHEAEIIRMLIKLLELRIQLESHCMLQSKQHSSSPECQAVHESMPEAAPDAQEEAVQYLVRDIHGKAKERIAHKMRHMMQSQKP
jgi:hypothetical protein